MDEAYEAEGERQALRLVAEVASAAGYPAEFAGEVTR